MIDQEDSKGICFFKITDIMNLRFKGEMKRNFELLIKRLRKLTSSVTSGVVTLGLLHLG